MKKYLLLSFFASFTLVGFGQTDSARLELDQIFQYIDKSQIPTGYLNSYSKIFTSVLLFCALPAAVALEATGTALPYPLAVSLLASIPFVIM